MELRHVRYFLAVAEERNFTRAAQRLGIGQPPLSMQIRDLEREVGAARFHRVPHGAELTEAGAAFLAEVHSLPGRFEDTLRAARRTSRGETGTLALGFTGTAALNPTVAASIRAFRRAFPGVTIRVEEANSIERNAGLVEGRLDVALTHPAGSDPSELTVLELMSEPLVVALPEDYPAAAGHNPITLAMLREALMILAPRAVAVGLHDAALAACQAAGFAPVLGQAAPFIASILSLISSGLGVWLVPRE